MGKARDEPGALVSARQAEKKAAPPQDATGSGARAGRQPAYSTAPRRRETPASRITSTGRGGITMSVRKRTWTTRKGVAKHAFVLDYVDQHGRRHIETYKTE